jgi:hypothetical protein
LQVEEGFDGILSYSLALDADSVAPNHGFKYLIQNASMLTAFEKAQRNITQEKEDFASFHYMTISCKYLILTIEGSNNFGNENWRH